VQFPIGQPPVESEDYTVNNRAFGSTVVVSAAVLFLALAPLSRAQEQGRAGPPRAEYKAVSFGSDEDENTRKLNELAAQDWQYVGPLGQGMVAFRRESQATNAISIEVIATPKAVAPGEKATITVTVRTGDNRLLPGAKVTIAAGGGRFLAAADTPFDPKSRLHEPYSATGTTDKEGQFMTWWVVNPAAAGYQFSIEATREGYTGSKATLLIKTK
jgi:hypothetical protein